MKAFGFWVLFMAVGTFLTLNQNRLPQSYCPILSTKKKRDLDNMKLEDYHSIDPIPSSKVLRLLAPSHTSNYLASIAQTIDQVFKHYIVESKSCQGRLSDQA